MEKDLHSRAVYNVMGALNNSTITYYYRTIPVASYLNVSVYEPGITFCVHGQSSTGARYI